MKTLARICFCIFGLVLIFCGVTLYDTPHVAHWFCTASVVIGVSVIALAILDPDAF